MQDCLSMFTRILTVYLQQAKCESLAGRADKISSLYWLLTSQERESLWRNNLGVVTLQTLTSLVVAVTELL